MKLGIQVAPIKLAMPNLQAIEKEAPVAVRSRPFSATTRLVIQWIAGIAVAFGLGTWLVWWAAYSQHQFVLEEIRADCQRVMPEQVERCADTVIMQRGGSRR